MNTVQEKASLHEKAVQAVARGEVTPVKKKRARKKNPDLLVPDTVEHLRVHGDVWAKAKQIVADARNTYTHIEIRSDSEVIVR
jgi:hypothetical protein